MTDDEKQHGYLDGKDGPAAPASNRPQPLPKRAESPYFKAPSAEDAAARIVPQSADVSPILTSNPAAAASPSDHITWRDRLKGLWFAASLFFTAQTSQAELPPPTETTRSEINPQTSYQAQTGFRANYKDSAEHCQDWPASKFNFNPGSSAADTPQILDRQPDQIVQIIVNVQTEKPSETEIKDATDYIRRFQHELHKKVLDPEYLADKVVEGGEALLGVALFKARKKIRGTTQNRLVISLCDTFDRISEAFKEADDNAASAPQPKKRPIGFLADRIACSTEDTVAVLKLTPCNQTEPGQWELRESS